MENAVSAFLIRRRWLLLSFSLIALMAVLMALPNLQFNPSPRAFFGPDNINLQSLESTEDTYGRVNSAIMMIGPKDAQSPSILSLKKPG